MKSKEYSLPNQVKNRRIKTSTRLQKRWEETIYQNKSNGKQKNILAFEFYEEKRLKKKTKKLSNYWAKPTSNFEQNFNKML